MKRSISWICLCFLKYPYNLFLDVWWGFWLARKWEKNQRSNSGGTDRNRERLPKHDVPTKPGTNSPLVFQSAFLAIAVVSAVCVAGADTEMCKEEQDSLVRLYEVYLICRIQWLEAFSKQNVSFIWQNNSTRHNPLVQKVFMFEQV